MCVPPGPAYGSDRTGRGQVDMMAPGPVLLRLRSLSADSDQQEQLQQCPV